MIESKILYVIVSNDKDNYYEQMLLSAMSLRKHMPNIHVSVLTDNLTIKTFEGYRGLIKKYDNDFKVIDFPDDFSNAKRSRYLKTSMRQHIEGDFLFLDTDTLVLKEIDFDALTSEMGAVLDCHLTMSEFRGQSDERDIAMKHGYHDIEQYMNSGVIWCKDTLNTHKFYSEWHDLYIKLYNFGIHSDQISYNQINKKLDGIIKEVDGTYNCQVRFGINYFANASVLHYGGSGSVGHPCFLTTIGAFDDMKNNQCVTPKYEEYVNNPKSIMMPSMLYDVNAKEINCQAFYFIRLLSWKHKKIFKFVNCLCSIFYMLKKKLFG